MIILLTCFCLHHINYYIFFYFTIIIISNINYYYYLLQTLGTHIPIVVAITRIIIPGIFAQQQTGKLHVFFVRDISNCQVYNF